MRANSHSVLFLLTKNAKFVHHCKVTLHIYLKPITDIKPWPVSYVAIVKRDQLIYIEGSFLNTTIA